MTTYVARLVALDPVDWNRLRTAMRDSFTKLPRPTALPVSKRTAYFQARNNKIEAVVDNVVVAYAYQSERMSVPF